MFADELWLVKNFLDVLSSNGRLMLIPTIAEQYESLKAQREDDARDGLERVQCGNLRR